MNQTFEFGVSHESFIELPSPPGNTTTLVISINSGSTREDVTAGDVTFLKDDFFSGGETVVTDALVGKEDEILLYQTTRIGDFAYKFQSLVICGLDLFSQVGANTLFVISDLKGCLLVWKESYLYA
ncbi:hypothetical protein F2Q70_00015171 [Brassica cretica]|uniref:Uncharacterized protein n=1 Tax=Brassica cretica TaxID=69181 RepID=A0A8S9I5U8_BRACR|nr:hypothetical protein F2Q70_00015171 [Brassica cretica]